MLCISEKKWFPLIDNLVDAEPYVFGMIFSVEIRTQMVNTCSYKIQNTQVKKKRTFSDSIFGQSLAVFGTFKVQQF